jgi:hypothetical protein
MRDLTKWPLLLVRGESVTREQANEILIRTCVPGYLNVNDKEWSVLVQRILGLRNEDDPPQELWSEDRRDERIAWFKERWDFNRARADQLGILNLGYLYTSRIASSWIGGPHGWCDWDGTIASSNYNIGKWPSTSDVTEEWTEIAEAFPYLDLTAQLISKEGEGDLVGEWRVKDGAVTHNPEPIERLYEAGGMTDDDIKWAAVGIMTRNSGFERGVSPERLTEAVSQVEESVRARSDVPHETPTGEAT